jgi:hypothetical protein
MRGLTPLAAEDVQPLPFAACQSEGCDGEGLRKALSPQ